MTRDDIKRLAELEGQATKGEWSIDSHIIEQGDTPGSWHVYESGEDDPPLGTFDYIQSEDNARLTAALRNAAPDLFRLALRGLAAEKVVEAAREHLPPQGKAELCRSTQPLRAALADYDKEGKP